MGIREKLKKGVSKRVKGGKQKVQQQVRKPRRADAAAARERARQVRKRLEQIEAGKAPEPAEDTAEDQFARAQRTATVAPPINATLDPMGRPERFERAASGNRGPSRVDELARSRSDDSMADLVLGRGGPGPDEGPRLDAMATSTVGTEEREEFGFVVSSPESSIEGQDQPSLDALVPGVGPRDADRDDDMAWLGGEK